ncbi:flavin oxidoreductase [Nitratireductor aestuarii]|uniref:Flavin oxidoreductase n=1 Tax=Nitratireductor aestuarii TaxID=1735103 RepID=A0A916RLZ6_9HYPH|nr:flavin reductase [Nitratireductor aestuarii]GGA60278.1 flavin oxidoreductase [Nitratireductor aestuarii]
MTVSDVAEISGDPRDDTRAFRRALGQFATGVTVVTTESDGRMAGVTANSFSSLSLDPPLILWSIARTSRSFSIFESASHFAVSILGANQLEVSQAFASSSENKFENVAWRRGLNGVPLVEGAISTLECATDRIYDGGDHIIMVGRVERYSYTDGDALLYVQGRYGVADEHPLLKVSPAQQVEQVVEREDLPLPTLLYFAHHVLSAQFETYRAQHGITLAESRVIYTLETEGPISQACLTERSHLVERATREALDILLSKGLIVEVGNDSYALSEAGNEVAKQLNHARREFERKITAGMSRADERKVKEILHKLIRENYDPAN